MSNELTIQGARSPVEMLAQRELLENIYRSVMCPGIDYGMIPGTKERALLKPGAEVLRMAFNFQVEMGLSKEVDLSRDWVSVDTRCSLRDSEGCIVGQADANANSYESKFRYRWVSEKGLPQHIDKDTLPTRQQRGAYGDYTQYRLPTEDIGGLIHTLIRYAEKRAFVAAIHQATGASRIFREADEDEVEAGGKPTPAKGRPAPARGKAKAEPKPETPPDARPEEPPAEKAEPPADKPAKPRNRDARSITVEQQAAINHLLKEPSSKAAIQGINKQQGFGISKSEELSEYQAAVILHVLDGGAAEDIA